MTTLSTPPQFQLPQRPAPRSRGSGAAVVACLLLVPVLAIQVYHLTRTARSTAPAQVAVAGSAIPAEDLKAIAMKLEDRNLAGSAAQAWREYLNGAALEPLERARILYRVGKLEFAGERYESAVADLYIAERLAGDQDEDLLRQIALQVRECLQKMGRYAELTREIASRAAAKPGETGSLAGQQVVAEIGDEKITAADFDRMLASQIELAVSAQRGLSAQQAEEFRAQANKQFADPQTKVQHLQQLVAARVLAAEARDAGMESSDDYRQRLLAVADELLASSFMTQEVGKRATVTPEDVQRYFESNPDRYAEPGRSTLAHILCSSEEMAREVLKKAQEGEDFAALAEAHSNDERTKKSGGKISQPFVKGAESIPGIGKSGDLAAAIWAVSPGGILGDVYKTDAGWEVVKILERTERVEKTFDEVKDRAESDARAARQREVTQQYLKELFEKRGVKLYSEAFSMSPKPESK